MLNSSSPFACIAHQGSSNGWRAGFVFVSSFQGLFIVFQDFKDKYEIVQELQQAMHFFPPKKLVAMWLNSGVLTGEKPKRMRRRKIMPETGKPPEPGEGYEVVVADGDFGSDNEVSF